MSSGDFNAVNGWLAIPNMVLTSICGVICIVLMGVYGARWHDYPAVVYVNRQCHLIDNVVNNESVVWSCVDPNQLVEVPIFHYYTCQIGNYSWIRNWSIRYHDLQQSIDYSCWFYTPDSCRWRYVCPTDSNLLNITSSNSTYCDFDCSIPEPDSLSLSVFLCIGSAVCLICMIFTWLYVCCRSPKPSS